MKDSASEEFSPEENPPIKDAAALTRLFLKVQEILRAKQGQGLPIESLGSPLRATREGRVDAMDLIKLQEGLTGIDINALEAGDVVWWLTKSGSRGYFAIDTPSEKGNLARGGIQVDRSEGKKDIGEGWVNGASVGGMIKVGRILTGMPLEYHVKVEGQEFPKRVTTSLVQQAGVIKREEIKSPK